MDNFTTPTLATPTPATPTLATPTLATPTPATPTLATPTLATPTPAPAETWPPLPEVVTKIVMNGMDTDDGAFTALIGGIVGSILLLLICIIAVLLWCLSRQKGSYVTNEMDDTDADEDESVGSDTALQSREPLTSKEDE